MERFQLEKDIPIMCITADSFPDGVLTAHQKLHGMFTSKEGRKYFGVSRPEGETIIYKAGAEETSEGESQRLGLEKIVLKKGTYISSVIEDFMEHTEEIGKTFQQLLTEPDLDPNGYCVEWYINDNDVRCMVRLESELEESKSQ